MRIILGSESRWRKQLLAEMGYQFEVIAPNIDEKVIRDPDPEKLTTKLAEAKNKALRLKLQGRYLLITADQVVVVEGVIREKPESPEEGRRWLETAHIHPAQTYTAIAVYNSLRDYMLIDVDKAEIYFRQLPAVTVDALMAEGDMMKCAGGFTCEHALLDPYIDKVTGTRDSIQGFPKRLVARLIAKVR